MKTVLITGASSGIGREMAQIFAEHQYRPVLVSRRKGMLDIVAEDIKRSTFIDSVVIPIDLSKPQSADELVEILRKKDIYIDVLVNNAGFGDFSAFQNASLSKMEDMINLNMLTLTKLCRLLAPDMVANGFGHIVNIASTAAFQPIPNFAVYAATKAYVLNFSEALAFELKPLGVHVTTICPGATKSEFQETAGMQDSHQMFLNAPLSYMVAEFAFEAMMKRKRVAIYGSKNRFLTFMQRFSPRKLVIRMAGKMTKA
jgi:short-subunit dehydrogenase